MTQNKFSRLLKKWLPGYSTTNQQHQKKHYGWAAILLFLFVTGLGVFTTWHTGGLNDHKTAGLSDTFTDTASDEKEQTEQDEMDKAMEQEFELTKDPASNTVPRQRLIAADSKRKQLLAAWQSQRLDGAVSGINWAERGPNNVAGRTRALLYDLNDAGNGYAKVWAGSVGGGLWYTNDITTAGTPTWTRVDDFLGNLAITSLAQDAANPQTMYAGTGEGWFNSDAIQGLGIWKTTNGGTNWSQLASTNNSTFQFVQKILAYTNGGTNYVLACTRSGLMRSTDAGASWTKVLGNGTGGGSTDRAADIEMAADGTLYCSMGIFSIDGIYRSTNNGANWTKIYTSSSEYRIELACAPGNFDKIYAMVSNNASNPGLKKIMVTSNATAGTPTWTTVTLPPWCDQGSASTDMTRGQAWYDMIALVDGTDENTIYVGGVDLMKSTNGGASWTQITQWASGCAGSPANIHADNHALVFKPGSNSEFLAGNDGGIFRTVNSGSTFTSRNTSYNVTQYYACAAHPTNANYFLAGSQDNGTQKFTAAGLNTTTQASGGDGAFCHIDQDNPNFQITSFTGNSYNLSTNGGTSFSFVASFGNGSFINPTDFDDAGNKLYAGNTSGTYLRWNNPETGGANGSAVSVTAFGTGSITHVMVSPLTPNRVYFGLNNGSVVRVDNANAGSSKTGTVIKTGIGSVSCLAIDPANEDHMLVTYSNYGVTSIFESNNATQASPSWASVEGILPDMPVRWAVFDPRNSDWAIIATDLGVWSTDNLNSAGSTDWQPTNTGLANVRVDMLQYRPGDRTLVAATHGRGLFTAVVPNVSTPDINFVFGTGTGAEQNSASSGCRRYKDYTVDMSIANAPVGDAIVNLSVQAGNTAVQGVDFDFTTNGNFAAPASSATFTSGSTSNKTISIRIYEDAEVESSESFTLTYSISGTTDAQAGKGFQKYSFGIDDNDVAPFAGGAGSATVGTASFAGGYIQPFRSSFQKARSQYVYLASELSAAGIAAGNINAIGFNVLNKTSTQPFTGFTISFKNTSRADMTSLVYETGMSVGYSQNYSTVSGINTLTLSTPFAWDGTSNLLVEMCYDNATATGSGDAVASSSTVDDKGLWDRAATGVGCSLTGTFTSVGGVFVRPDIILTGTLAATPIESVLNANRSEYIATNGSYHFYNGSNIIASLSGVTANLGCVTSNIFEAGNTWQVFQGGFRSQKVWDISPTTNPGASYTIKLYFTAAELSTYLGSANTLRIAKTTAATMATADASNTVKVDLTTATPFGTGYVFSATFTGFSKFFLIDAGVTLPVTLLTFRGHLENKTIPLDWSTSQELNSKSFEIEKSTNGTDFTNIGKVAAAGSSFSQRNYSFTDTRVMELNYYRLKMVDNDGRFAYSQTILIRNPDAVQEVWVLNNPFDTYLDLRLSKMPKAPVHLELLNAAGARVYFREYGLNDRLRLDVSGTRLSAGTYLLRATIDDKAYTSKVVKQ